MMLPVHPPVVEGKRAVPIAWASSAVFASMLLGNNLFTKITLLICLVFFSFANRRVMPEVVGALRHVPGLAMFELWAVASIFWSVVPTVSMDIVVTQSAFFCLCVLMAREAADRDLAGGLKLAAYFVVSMVVLYAMAFPAAAISAHGFKAFYGNKNALGVVLALCLIIIVHASRMKWLDWGMAGVTLALLVMSRSKTSMIVTAGILVFSLLLWLSRRQLHQMDDFPRGLIKLIGRGMPFLFYALIGIGIFWREAIADLLIRVIPYDFLTGRGELWVMVLRRTELDLLRGIGPGAFWSAGPLSEVAQTSLLAMHPGWVDKLGSADGGYIDMIGSFGFIGLGLLLVSMVNNYRRFCRVVHTPAAPLLLALISFFVLHNVTETTVYQSTNALWFLYLFASFSLVFLDVKKSTAQTRAARAFEVPDSRFSDASSPSDFHSDPLAHDASSHHQPVR